MKAFIGPIERLKLKVKIDEQQRLFTNIFYLVTIVMPILLFLLFRFDVIKGDTIVKPSQESAVGVVNNGTGSFGTGFLINKNQLITAAHVVKYLEIGDGLQVKFEKNPKWYDAILKYKPESASEDKDYAVLELRDATFTNYYELSLSENLAKLNDKVLVIGYPGGTFSSSPGEITNTSWRENTNYLQLWAGAWPGNSGGPVIHRETGKVIGILSAGDIVNEGMIIAVKTDLLYSDMELNKVVNLNAPN